LAYLKAVGRARRRAVISSLAVVLLMVFYAVWTQQPEELSTVVYILVMFYWHYMFAWKQGVRDMADTTEEWIDQGCRRVVRKYHTVRCSDCETSVELPITKDSDGCPVVALEEVRGWTFPPARCPECARKEWEEMIE